MGYQAAKILLESSKYHVLIGSRVVAKGEEAEATLKAFAGTQGTIDTIQIDVTDDASVDTAAETIASRYGRLDVLVNNAGICPESAFAGKNTAAPPARSVMREVFSTNCIGVVSVTEAMLPLLRKSSSPRLVFVSSSTGSLTQASDPKSRFHTAGRSEYRASKTALNFLMLQYWIALKDAGFLVSAADPGLNATNLTGDEESLRNRGAPEPSVGGERIAKVVRGDRDADVGKVCGDYGEIDVCSW